MKQTPSFIQLCSHYTLISNSIYNQTSCSCYCCCCCFVCLFFLQSTLAHAHMPSECNKINSNNLAVTYSTKAQTSSTRRICLESNVPKHGAQYVAQGGSIVYWHSLLLFTYRSYHSSYQLERLHAKWR